MSFKIFFFLLTFIILEIGATPTANSTTTTTPSPVKNSTTTPAPVSGNSSSISATIYTMAHFHGVWWTLDLSKGGCEDLPSLLQQKASSIDTHDGCIVLHSEVECKGRSVMVAPGTSGHSDLSMVNFNNLISSMKPCGGSGANKGGDNKNKNLTTIPPTTNTPTTPKNPVQVNETIVDDEALKQVPNITLTHVIY